MRRAAALVGDPTAFARGIIAEVFCVGILGTLAFIAVEAARWLGR